MATSFLTELLKRPVYTVGKDITLTEVIGKLAKLNIGSLPVVDKGSKLLGIISERDLIKNAQFFRSNNFLSLKVKDVMTKKVIRCDSMVTSEDLMRLMTDNKIGHTPIVRGNFLVGIVSLGDVVKRLLEKYKWETENLKQYLWLRENILTLYKLLEKNTKIFCNYILSYIPIFFHFFTVEVTPPMYGILCVLT